MILAVVGPTASGKSDLALDLAQVLDAEIVGADAMQLYRGMDIGTAKLPLDQRRGIKHYQIDVLDLADEASVAAYQREARGDLEQILRDRPAVVVGGSGLYIRALLDEMVFPPTDPAARARLESELEQFGPAHLHQRLAALDPQSSESINPANGRRIVRALEVIELTGQPYSATLPSRTYVKPARQIGIRVDAQVLDDRIGRRAAAMFQGGLLDEVEHLKTLGLETAKTASRATGYAQALSVLAGDLSVDEAIESTALATRQLARRQMKWFGADPRIEWVDGTDPKRTLVAAKAALDL